MFLRIMMVVLLIGMSIGAEGTSIEIDPTSQNVDVGESFSVDFIIDGVVDLAGFQIYFSFDNTVVQWVSNSLTGTVLNNPFVVTNASNQLAALSVPAASFTGSGLLFTANFTAIAAGLTSITIIDMGYMKSKLSDSTGTAMTYSVVNGQVNVENPEIPEPMSVMLVASGVAAMAMRRRIR